MTITHSPIESPTGNRYVVDLPPSVGLSSAPNANIEFLAWESTQREPQELELLMYPTFEGANPAHMLPAWGRVQIGLTYALGAGQQGNSIQHDVIAYLPDHGMKFRLAARSLRVRLGLVAPLSFTLIGAIAPAIGAQHSAVFPPVSVQQFQGAIIGELIPKGATEFRCSMPRQNTGATIAYGTPGLPPGGLPGVDVLVYDNAPLGVGSIDFLTCLGESNPAYLPMRYPQSYEWLPIPGEAYRYKMVDALTTVHFR